MSRFQKTVLISLVSLSLAPFAQAAKVIDLKGQSPTILQNLLPSKPIGVARMAASPRQDGLRLSTQNTDTTLQISHKTYQQYHNGIPVYGKVVVTHEPSNVNKLALSNGKMAVSMSGALVENIEQDTQSATPSFDDKSALSFAKQRYGRFRKLSGSQYAKEKTKLVYFLDKNNKAHLAYVVSFFVDAKQGGKPAQPTYIIDASNKSILKSFNALKTNRSPVQAEGEGGNTKTGEYTYGKDYDFLDISLDNGVCYLENSMVKTVDMKHRESDYQNNPYHFSCSAPTYKHSGDEYRGSFSVQDDAHYFGEVIAKMYQQWYQTNALDFQLVMRVHYGYRFENAFWDGETMNFGDGDTVFYPLVSLDVAAHEVSHGFTQQHSDLEYSDQSGGLNESFSDMAGKTAEYYMRGKNTWGLGEDITKNGFGATCADGSTGALRCMDEPARDDISIGDARDYPKLVKTATDYAMQGIQQIIEQYKLPVQADWLDNPPSHLSQDQKDVLDQLREYREQDIQGFVVHTASGVFNRAFYQLATTPDWDIRKAFHVFLYANQNHYWTPSSNFNEAAYGAIQATRALQYNVKDVRAAFDKVGIICDDNSCHTAKA